MDDEIMELDIAYEVWDMLLDGHCMVEAIEYVTDKYGLTTKECKRIEKIARNTRGIICQQQW